MFFIEGQDTDLIDETEAQLSEDLGAKEATYGEAYDGDKSILEDTNLWVLIGFIAVIGLFVWQGVFKKLGTFLDGRAKTIQDQLDEARSLREEAQKLLADYQKRQREAETEAEGIIAQAKADAKTMQKDAKAKLEEQVARRTQAAHDRIARAEAQALADVRAQTADLAVDAAREIIKARTDGSAQKALLDRAIGDIRGKLN
ncbi:F0F1 ATP synthase subunit B [Parvularcula sp. ZS-1/3]|uniref:ATP synthase subunit b n=2 Tax=Parvularcula mediterranea TaxID=2732508 RepID=A0A7Y3RNZ5_9PROT|nr:F0F1 ATP synthase subunit B [Parvularcula mediterranea]